MLPCHSCYIYGTWRSKEVGGLNSSYGGKLKGEATKSKGRGALFIGELTPLRYSIRITYLFQPLLI